MQFWIAYTQCSPPSELRVGLYLNLGMFADISDVLSEARIALSTVGTQGGETILNGVNLL